MSTSLRPILRPSALPSLPSATSQTTYICQSCRHARLLKRPKRPYTFTQLVTLSDGSAFTMRTTSPLPVYRSSRDTRNAPLWNPSSRELLSVEEDEAGRLAGFRARFGSSFDASKDMAATTTTADMSKKDGREDTSGEGLGYKAEGPTEGRADKSKRRQQKLEDELGYQFDEEDENLLDMISSYGTADKGSAAQIARKKI